MSVTVLSITCATPTLFVVSGGSGCIPPVNGSNEIPVEVASSRLSPDQKTKLVSVRNPTSAQSDCQALAYCSF
jgi:hypothetical protein